MSLFAACLSRKSTSTAFTFGPLSLALSMMAPILQSDRFVYIFAFSLLFVLNCLSYSKFECARPARCNLGFKWRIIGFCPRDLCGIQSLSPCTIVHCAVVLLCPSVWLSLKTPRPVIWGGVRSHAGIVFADNPILAFRVCVRTLIVHETLLSTQQCRWTLPLHPAEREN